MPCGALAGSAHETHGNSPENGFVSNTFMWNIDGLLPPYSRNHVFFTYLYIWGLLFMYPPPPILSPL